MCAVHTYMLKAIFFCKHAGKMSVKITLFLGTGVRLFQKQNLPLEGFGFFGSSNEETVAFGQADSLSALLFVLRESKL